MNTNHFFSGSIELIPRTLPAITRVVLSLVALCLAGAALAKPAEARPNILVILFDDVGFMDFGAYGSNSRTPNIDRVAKSGVKFSRYCSSPFCGPSRAMLLTGMDNHQVGMGTLVETVTPEMQKSPGYSMHWKEDQKTIAGLLAEAGYRTYATGKWGIGEAGANLPKKYGFEKSYVMDATGGSNYNAKPYLPGYHDVDWFEDDRPVKLPADFYSSRNLVDKMIGYIDGGDTKKPFFAFLALQAVHIPVQAPTSYIDSYNGTFDAGWDVMRQERLRRAIDLGLVPPTTKLAPAPKTHRAWNDLSPDEKKIAAREMQVNAGMMTAADEHVGRLLKHLESSGQLDNTIVIITSDNGAEAAVTKFSGIQKLVVRGIEAIEGFNTSPENMGQTNSLTAIGPEWASVSSAPFHLYKFYGSEGGLRVPLIVSGPGIKAKGILDAPVHVADLVPTMLDAAKVPYNANSFYGRSALPMLSGKATSSRTESEGFGFEVSGNAAYYRGKWKITRLAPPLGDRKWRLYDLSTDPGETNDVSAANQKLFESMIDDYKSYSKTVGVIELGPEDSAFKQLFKNVVKKALHKYWPYLVVAGLLVCVILFFAIKQIRKMIRKLRQRQRQKTNLS